jgi:segregation and condensation protein B
MRTLLDREWVSQKGAREVPGRPALYVTTSKFLEYFGLMRLADLPVLGEQRQLNEIARELGIILPRGERDVVADNIVPEDNVPEDIDPVEGDNRIDHSHVSIGETPPAVEAESEVDVEGGDADRLLEAEVSVIG